MLLIVQRPSHIRDHRDHSIVTHVYGYYSCYFQLDDHFHVTVGSKTSDYVNVSAALAAGIIASIATLIISDFVKYIITKQINPIFEEPPLFCSSWKQGL